MAPKTPDLDALLEANTRRTAGGVCSIGLALAAMDPTTRTKVDAAFADTERFAATGLTAVLRGLGHDVGRSAVDRHRRKECKCRT